MPGRQSRRYVFTWNNYRDGDVSLIQRLEGSDDVVYCVCGKEVGESGTRHLQGYIELRTKRTVGGLKRLFESQVPHIEIARGTFEQNYQYCTKDGDYFCFGDPIEESAVISRSRLMVAATAIRSGQSIHSIASEDPAIVAQYYRGFQFLSGLFSKPRNFKSHVIWWYGNTGVGKSRGVANDAALLCPDSTAWMPDPTLKWFDGYCGERGVIIDEFAGNVLISWLNRLCDRYPLKVPVKGGYVEWRPRFIWITSQYHPFHYYDEQEEETRALIRRIDELKEVREET